MANMKRMEDHFRIARTRLPDASRKLALGIGHLVIQHNFAHLAFASLFTQIVVDEHEEWPAMSLNLWHTQRTDKAQRELLVAAARAKFAERKRTLNAILWALKKADVLSEFRNDVVHVQIGLDVRTRPYFVVFNAWATPPARYERLRQEVKLTRSLKTATDDLYKLGKYVFGVEHHLDFEGVAPLPKRPRLHFVRGKHHHLALFPETLL